MSRKKGRLLRTTPYKISGKGKYLQVSINQMSGLKSGDYVFEEVINDGIIMLIPKKLYLKEK